MVNDDPLLVLTCGHKKGTISVSGESLRSPAAVWRSRTSHDGTHRTVFSMSLTVDGAIAPNDTLNQARPKEPNAPASPACPPNKNSEFPFRAPEESTPNTSGMSQALAGFAAADREKDNSRPGKDPTWWSTFFRLPARPQTGVESGSASGCAGCGMARGGGRPIPLSNRCSREHTKPPRNP